MDVGEEDLGTPTPPDEICCISTLTEGPGPLLVLRTGCGVLCEKSLLKLTDVKYTICSFVPKRLMAGAEKKYHYADVTEGLKTKSWYRPHLFSSKRAKRTGCGVDMETTNRPRHMAPKVLCVACPTTSRKNQATKSPIDAPNCGTQINFLYVPFRYTTPVFLLGLGSNTTTTPRRPSLPY